MSIVKNRAGDVVRAGIVGFAAGLLAFLALGPTAAYGLQVWAILTGWASFLVLGGGFDGFRRSIVHSFFGAVLALGALVFATNKPEALNIDFAVWASLGVALTVALITLAARFPALGSIPASLLGYVTVLSATMPDYRLERILAPSVENPVVGALASLIFGALFAFAAEEVARRLRSRIGEARAST
jgi:hypothetical protein